MKRIFALLLALLFLALPLLVACEASDEEGEEDKPVEGTVTLYVYNWGEYISDGSEDSLDSNAAFEEYFNENLAGEFGFNVKVNYSTFSSVEDMYARIASGAFAYDVIVPSDYMIERMINEGLLRKLNFDNIPEFENIDPAFQNLDYDPTNEYTVPYSYGMIGVIYNTSIVDEENEDIGSWRLMFNPETEHAGDILQFNNPRDAFGTALYYLGYDVNDTTPEHWNEALALLKEQKNIVQGYVMDEIFNKMESGSAAIAAYYAGDFLSMYESNEDLEFFYPAEGTNYYVDAFCIPHNSQHPEVAEAYINFMLTEEPAVANAEATYYASPNLVVRESEEYQECMNEIKEDAMDILYGTPSEDYLTIAYRNLDDDGLAMLNDLWEELKVESSISTTIYVMCAVIIGVVLGFAIFFWIRRRIRAI